MTNVMIDNLAAGLNYRDTYVASGGNKSLFWLESSNVKPFKDFGMRKSLGNTLIVAHGTKIISAGNYDLGASEYLMFVDADGSLFEYDTEASTKSAALLTGLDDEARGAWAMYGQGIIYSNGVDEPFIYFRGRLTTTTGTAALNGTTSVVGTSTLFTTELQVGDVITINSEVRVVDTITDDTHLTVRTAFSTTASGKAVTRNKITYLIAVGAEGSVLRSTAIAVYKGRVYIAYLGGLFWTAQGTYTDWLTEDDAGYNKNFFNNSSTIQALSLYDNFLAIHRKNQVVLLQDNDGSPENFIFDIKANKGSSSQFGNSEVLNDLIFYDAGIWPLGQTGLQDQVQVKADLAALINNDKTGFLKGMLDTARVDEITILHNKDEREIWCYFPITNVAYFQFVYVYDYELKIWYRRISPQTITCAVEHKNVIYSFDASGNIYKEDTGTDWAGATLSFYAQGAFLHFGEPHQQKDIDEIKILADSEVNNDFDYKFFFDYDNYNSTATQNIIIEGDSDALIWSDDDETVTETVWANAGGTTGNDWAELVVGSNYLDNYNGVKSISLYLFGSGAGQDLGLVSIEFLGVKENSI